MLCFNNACLLANRRDLLGCLLFFGRRHVDVDPLRPLRQVERDENLDALGLYRLVAGGVLAFEVGIDRYLDSATSANRRDEVDGGNAASLANEVDGIG